MGASPKYKIYRGKEYVASVKYLEDAAALVAITGEGTVRLDPSRIIWTEGNEAFSAGDSFDEAALVMRNRIRAHEESFKRVHQ